jgi:hypothetical protein
MPRVFAVALASLALLTAAACSDEETTGPGTVTPTSTTAPGGQGGVSGGGGSALGGAGGLGGAAGEGGSGAQPLALTYYDVNQVLSTGQSLSVGAQGAPALSTEQPYDNLMFSGGVAATTALTEFAPLVEGVDPAVETMSSAFANFVTQMARDEVLVSQPVGEQTHDVLVTLHGLGGTAYVGLAKGTPPYANGMAQLAAAAALTQSQSLSHVVRAVTTVHGESDHVADNPSYEANLVEWQADYEADVRATTNQTEPVPMLQTQMSSWTHYGEDTSQIPAAQLSASENHPDSIILVGPKYAMAYAPDGVHLTNEGYQHMGEYYAKAYRRVVLEGRRWYPLAPLDISRTGAIITVTFRVPEPPLVLDTELVSDPGSFGFEYVDGSGAPPAIASVTLTAPDTVTITLESEPTGTAERLRYAFTGVGGQGAGPTTGPRGNLRDSDATVSPHGYPLYNWCVHFDKPVP